MIPEQFEYHTPRTLHDAIALLQTHGDEAKLLAGGHSLLPLMKLRLTDVSHLIDIRRIEGLAFIRRVDDILSIGAMTTHSQLAESGLLQRDQPLLPKAASQIGDVQVRNCGTLGGSLAHADPAADLVPVLLALEAELRIQGPSGERCVAAGDFIDSMFTSTLEDDEILTEIRVPIVQPNSRCVYEKVLHKASHLAVVGVAAQVAFSANHECTEARLALTGLAPVAFRARDAEALLRGQVLSGSTIAAAAARVADGITPLSDTFASADYRLHLARVHTARALAALADA
ncbi:MAG: xanthine dehydrogenase family protein subunit M [bacterium]|nr:xanthine dehydrogenase family protein subunit M [bacterium]